MLVNGEHTTSIRYDDSQSFIEIIDQRELPHHLTWERLDTCEQVAVAIEDMHLRGAPLIGAAAGFGMYFALKEALSGGQGSFDTKVERLRKTRPTAVNLLWAIDQQLANLKGANDSEKLKNLWDGAVKIVEDDIRNCAQIGEHGLDIIREIYEKTQKTVNILTHCNAGWLACLDWGTATAPIYMAQKSGIPIHVWVDETRPRNQGAKLTAWELQQQGVPCTLISDNTGGHLMQHQMVDLVIVGSDRTTISGDVANKIGTYLKALAAHDNKIPFYVALPSSTFDPTISDGVKEIPIETRGEEEVTHMDGATKEGIHTVRISPLNVKAINYGFDVTPARLVSALITEKGVCQASKDSITKLYPEFLA